MENIENGQQIGAGRYLCFSLGLEKFAIPLLQVKEVLGNLKFTSIPHSPPYFKGIVNLRGQVISVIDLRQKLKSTSKPAEVSETTTIILDFGALSELALRSVEIDRLSGWFIS